LTVAPEQWRPRRLTATQGRALEILGHAIEYLVDSRLACADEFCSPAAQEAIQLLSRANREVYQDAPATAPPGSRIIRWLMQNLLG
jgi:sulfur carrier protein